MPVYKIKLTNDEIEKLIKTTSELQTVSEEAKIFILNLITRKYSGTVIILNKSEVWFLTEFLYDLVTFDKDDIITKEGLFFESLADRFNEVRCSKVFEEDPSSNEKELYFKLTQL